MVTGYSVVILLSTVTCTKFVGLKCIVLGPLEGSPVSTMVLKFHQILMQEPG